MEKHTREELEKMDNYTLTVVLEKKQMEIWRKNTITELLDYFTEGQK